MDVLITVFVGSVGVSSTRSSRYLRIPSRRLHGVVFSTVRLDCWPSCPSPIAMKSAVLCTLSLILG